MKCLFLPCFKIQSKIRRKVRKNRVRINKLRRMWKSNSCDHLYSINYRHIRTRKIVSISKQKGETTRILSIACPVLFLYFSFGLHFPKPIQLIQSLHTLDCVQHGESSSQVSPTIHVLPILTPILIIIAKLTSVNLLKNIP